MTALGYVGVFLLGIAVPVALRAWFVHRAWERMPERTPEEDFTYPAFMVDVGDLTAHAARLPDPELLELAQRITKWLPDDAFAQLQKTRR